MDLSDFGVTVAIVAATGGLEHVGAKVVDSVSEGVVHLRTRLREWFSTNDDSGRYVELLEEAEKAPTELNVKLLAVVLDSAAVADPAGASEIAAMVEQIVPGSFTVVNAKFANVVRDNAQVGRIYQADEIDIGND